MNSPPVPTPEMRKRVAEAVVGDLGWLSVDQMMTYWERYGHRHTPKLISTIARKIVEKENTGRNMNGRVKYANTLWRRLGKALATNNTSALEQLCWELIEGATHAE